jgi:DNA-binding CsgD family transcriptional regulator
LPTTKPSPPGFVDRCTLGGKCLCGKLSPRRRQVLHRVLEGDGEKQMARRLGISVHTVHLHLRHMYAFFGVNSRLELMALAVKTAAGVGVRPRAIRHNIGLTEEQRTELRRLLLVSTGATRQQIRHASILLRLDGQADDYTIAERLDISNRTVERVRAMFLNDGLPAAIAPRRSNTLLAVLDFA